MIVFPLQWHTRRGELLCEKRHAAICQPVRGRVVSKIGQRNPLNTDSPARSQLVQAQAMGCKAGGVVLGEAGGAAGAEGWDLLARLGAGSGSCQKEDSAPFWNLVKLVKSRGNRWSRSIQNLKDLDLPKGPKRKDSDPCAVQEGLM